MEGGSEILDYLSTRRQVVILYIYQTLNKIILVLKYIPELIRKGLLFFQNNTYDWMYGKASFL